MMQEKIMSQNVSTTIEGYLRRINAVKQSSSLLDARLLEVEASLVALIEFMDAVGEQVKDVKVKPPTARPKTAPAKGMSPDDFKAIIEKMVQRPLK